MASILVEGKVIGNRRPLFTDREFPLLPSEDGAEHVTLRELIARIVRAEVSAHEDRQERQATIQALTQADIERGLMKGKVDSGGRDRVGPVDGQEAVRTAVQAFEDGVYYVFVDDEQVTDLDCPVALHADSRVTFLRLVALAGG